MIWEVILEYCNRYPLERAYLLSKIAFLETVDNPFPRTLLPGHITGSGIVIRNQEILLIHHRYIKEWFQPGGHVDPNELPLATAIRELEEETGWKTQVSDLHPKDIPIDIDVHLIPANPLKNELEHLHIDFAYLLDPVAQGEASDPEMVGWFSLNECTAPRLARCIQKYRGLIS